MPKQTKKPLSIAAQAKRYADRTIGTHEDKFYESEVAYRAFRAGYAAARRDPMVINGIIEPARWAEIVRWSAAVMNLARPNETIKTNADFKTDLGVRQFVAEMFRLPIPTE